MRTDYCNKTKDFHRRYIIMKRFLTVFALSLAGLFCLPLFGCSVRFSADKYSDSDKYSTGNFTYNASEISRIELNWDSGSVSVSESDADSLSVSESGADLPDEKRLHYMQDGKTLRIQFCKSGFVGTFPLEAKKLRLEVPAGTELVINSASAPVELGSHTLRSLELYSTSGSVSTGSIHTNDTLLIDTTSGSIKTADLNAGGDLILHSTSGTIQTGNASAANTNVKTTSGSFRADSVDCLSFTVKSTSGSINAGLSGCDSADIECTSGSVRLRLLDGLGASVKHESTSGSFNSNDYTVKNGRYVFGSGKCRLEVRTTSGSLTIE